jgi:outer membrane receptor protein involved in Fe transport
VGGNTSWKIGLESLPTYAVRFRATISESVRAPNVAELYAGASEVFFGVADACDGIDNSSTGNTAENCRSIPAIQQRIDEQGAFVLSVLEKGTTAGFQSGNPELSEETAESWTLGVVWTPERLENLSVAMDWYDIEIEDAIRLVDRATVVSRCYGVEPSLFDPDCGGRTIRYDGNGVLIEVNNSVSNEDDIDTSGLDIEVSYFLGLNRIYSKAGGQFSLGLLYSYLHEFEITEIASGLVDDDAGEVLYPEHRLNLSLGYTYSDLTLSWRIAYIDESVDSNTPQDMNENSAVIGPLDDNANTCSATTYHDVQAAYEFGSVEAYLGVNNLLDEAPCVLGQFTQYGSPGTNTNASMYDVTGREYYAGLRVRF